MKTNTKKATATKAKATPAKKSMKPAAKTTAKKVAKPAVKAVAKSVAKTVVKKTASKAAPQKIVKKAAAPVKSAAKAPVKAKTPVKATAIAKKSVKESPKASKIAVKKVKPLLKAEKKAPVAKKSAEKAVKTVAAAKSPEKAAAKPSAFTAARPILVKMPHNQNVPVRTPLISTVRPMVTNFVQSKTSADSAPNSAMVRPVYRPIQVINKSLTPIQPTRQMAPVSKADEKVEFKKGDYVVYPAHGVGEIEAVETQTIGGVEIKLYAIVFEKDRMRLKVPVFKAHGSGLRKISSASRMQDAMKTLQGRAQIRRAMWSRRAQEYETKINSGDPVAIAEVLRDLRKSNDETEQSYSERQIYQSALERLAREVAAIEKITEIEAAERLETMIKSKRARNASAETDTDMDMKEAASA